MTELIVVICNDGHADEVMDVAKKNGASGGTILHGRGSVAKNETFFGILIQPEKELVLIIVDNSIRNNIMQAIRRDLGEMTKANALCFSLPVDATAGLSRVNEIEKENK